MNKSVATLKFFPEVWCQMSGPLPLQMVFLKYIAIITLNALRSHVARVILLH